MKMRKLLFVFNPTAGKSKINSKLSDVIDLFTKNGYLTTVYPTQCKDDARRVIEERSARYDLVVCSGGDGTLNEVVTGMMNSQVRVPIGYIPSGTTNDYAKSIGIPKGILKAAEMAVCGSIFNTDIGSFNEKTFVYVAAFGLFTDVSYQTSQQAKQALGHSAYVFEGMKRLLSVQPYHMKIQIDDEVIEDDFIYGMVSNTVSVGGFKTSVMQEVVLDDGLFEVVLVKNPKNPIELQAIVSSLLIDGIHSEFVCEYKAKYVRVEAQDEVAWTLDGEFGGEVKVAEIRNRANAVSLIADAKNMDLSADTTLRNVIEQKENRKDS